MRDGLAAKGDARGAIVPRPADVELDIPAVGLVFEGDGRLVGEDCGLSGNVGGKVGEGESGYGWVSRIERLARKMRELRDR